MIGIYKITSPSGGINIGQTWDIEKRKRNYKILNCKHQPKLYESIKKYGWKNHIFEILQELPVDVTQDILDQLEIVYIQQYKECGCKMLNIKEGGRGGKHSEETKRKISEAGKGRKLSEEHKRILIENNKNKVVTIDTRNRIGKAHKGKIMSEETRIKIGLASKGRTHSEYTKELLRGKNKGRKMTNEQIRKMSENGKGKNKGKSRPIIICTVCGKEGGTGTMHRWHFDNCGKRTPMLQETRDKIANSLKMKGHTLQAVIQTGKLKIVQKLDKILTVHNLILLLLYVVTLNFII